MLVGHYFENRETTTDKNLKGRPARPNVVVKLFSLILQ